MKNKRIIAFIAIVIVLTNMYGCFKEPDNNHKNEIEINTDQSNNAELNYLGGQGEFSSYKATFGNEFIADNNTVYLNTREKLIAFSKDEKFRPICMDASCNHQAFSCIANVSTRYYFVMNGNLYYANRSDNCIYDTRTEKKMYEIKVPEELLKGSDADKYAPEFSIVEYISEGYIKVNATKFVYILDENFNTIIYHINTGEQSWGAVFDNIYYYVNDLDHLAAIDLDLKKEIDIDINEFIMCVSSNENYIMFSNEFGEFYRYAPNSKTMEFVCDNIDLFTLYGKYIYYVPEYINDSSREIRATVMDENGNKLGNLDLNNDYDMYSGLYLINDNVYAISFDESKIFISDVDGKNSKEISLQDNIK